MILRIHRAWWVAAVTFLVLLASAAFRSSLGVMLVPVEQDTGFSRTATSVAVAVNLVLYGLAAPFAAALAERFGVRTISAVALALTGLGSGLAIFATSAWQLVLLWGVVVGLGVGSTALVLGALVVNRWFVSHRGLVLGIIGAAFSTGQLIFVPTLAHVVDASGWQSASVLVAGLCGALIPLVILVVRDRPSDVGLRPLGATGDITPAEAAQNASGSGWTAAASAITTLRVAARTRPFWLLAGTFFICGWTTNGIISTHFIPATHDHGMPVTTAAWLLAVVGVFDIIGVIGSGWLTDKIDPRVLLLVYYTLRGAAMLATPLVLGPDVEPPLLLVLMLFGLDWVATVPPTAMLCRRIYGIERGAVVFGWVFAAHMVGAAVAASVSGWLRSTGGSYTSAWLLAGVLAVAAGIAAMAIPRGAPEPTHPVGPADAPQPVR